MRKIIIFIVISVLISACVQSTSTPQPTQPAPDFPTPVVESMPACLPMDLLTSASSVDANGSIMIGMTVTNKSGKNCSLANPPDVVLVDVGDKVIDGNYIPSSVAQTPPAPTLLGLAPSDSAIVTVVWSNYCKQVPGNKLIIRLSLAPEKIINVALNLSGLPHCDNSTASSNILVAPYSNPP
jgi:hypothetical protein